MRVCLVSALTIPDFGDPDRTKEATPLETRLPLGVLSIAAVLEQKGITPVVINLDTLFVEFITQGKGQNLSSGFLSYAIETIVSCQFDILGFSTICSSYPLTLRLAKEIKGLRPQIPIVLGGPQATVVDIVTLNHFPSIDYIVRQEADESFPQLLEVLENFDSHRLNTVLGITYRQGEQIKRNPNAPAIPNLDLLPLPAFHLQPPSIGASCPLEIGRGCPFQCTFCSTSEFFGRKFRLKSPETMIEQMRIIKERYQIYTFSLDHDMFTADRKRVVRFCEALLACGDTFHWTCSARTDCIDDELIALMARAGCHGIFFGIETGSERLQRTIRKNLNLSDARKRIECASKHKISTAVALIIAFPEETKDDLRQTLHFFVDSLRFDYAEPQLSLLAPIAGTSLEIQYRKDLIFDHLFSNISHQGWRMDPADIEIIEAYPEVFTNFYSIPTEGLERSYFQEVQDFIVYLSIWIHWLPVLLLQDCGDLLRVFEGWRKWWKQKYSDNPAIKTMQVPYLNQGQFPKDFMEYVRECYLKEMARTPDLIQAFIDSDAIRDLRPRQPQKHVAEIEKLSTLTPSSYPYHPANVWPVGFKLDYKILLECLRTKGDLREVPLRNSNVVFERIDKRSINVHQLSFLSENLWRMCDGTKTVKEITALFSEENKGEFEEVPCEKACFYGLDLLKEQNLLAISSEPV